MLAAQETDHLGHQRQRCDLGAQEVHHLHFPDLVCELDLLIFVPTEQKLHVSLGEQIADATWLLASAQGS